MESNAVKLDKGSREILEKLLRFENGIDGKNKLWLEEPKLDMAKDTFLDKLENLRICGAVEISPIEKSHSVIIVPEVAKRFLEKNILIFPENSPSDGHLIPVWFRLKRTIMEKVEKAITETSHDNPLDTPILTQFKSSLDGMICNNELFVSREICGSRMGVWDQIENVILRQQGDSIDILSFLLYEVRAALFLKSIDYVQSKREEMEPEKWNQLVEAFRERWIKITTAVRYSGSMEEHLPDQVFDSFVLREDVDRAEGQEYTRMVYEAVKWHSITRVRSDLRFHEDYERALNVYEERGLKLLHKAQQHKKYKIGRHRRVNLKPL